MIRTKGSLRLIVIGVFALALVGSLFVTALLDESEPTGSVISANVSNESVHPGSVEVSAGRIVRVDISSG
ncbi:MAG: hypothetical protein ACMXYM_02525 [Candidatus Woesearchaeota archaeon]